MHQQLGDLGNAHQGASSLPALPGPRPPSAGDILARVGNMSFSAANGFTPEPPYPPAARQEGREGVVELELVILPTGRVQAAQVSQTSGHADLDRAARETVLAKWRFPAGHLRRGQFVRVTFQLTAAEGGK